MSVLARLLLPWLVVLLWIASGAQAVAAPPEGGVVDDRGRPVRLDKPPQRIVSLLPSLTETVCALGACDRLVAVDDYSNWPASVRALPHVGGLEDTQVEAIVALRPDLVLAAGSSRTIGRLESLGIPVAALEPRRLDDLRRVIGQLDALLATSRGDALWARIQRELTDASQRLGPAQNGQRVYFEVGSGPYAASEASFVGELLARLGAVNVVAGHLGPFPRLNPEFVVRADPQVIMHSSHAEPFATRPGWAGIRAVRDKRICRFVGADADVLVRPGPRVAQGVRLMADCLQQHGRSGG
ncbi:helical backbone metal receptor [Ramlibacter sp. AN1015]|uniref:ABC transporter substrate-binding protein n=1 Tax=Ramlibacter sp. AN1015 TaxID=3133428 RepID=UPI0030BA3391